MRLVNRVLATLLAAALVALGLLVVVEVIVGYYLEREPWLVPHDRWYADGVDTTWSERGVMFAFVLVGLAGLAILGLQLARRRSPTLALEPTSDRVHADVGRRSLEQAITRAVERVDGVSATRVRLRRRKAAVRVRTDRRLLGDLRARVARAADGVIADLGLAQPLTVDAKVTSRRPAERSR